MRISINSLSQRGTAKTHNEDSVLLDGQVHQGRVREHGAVDTLQPHFFTVADGVSSGTFPLAASRRLLELLQTHLETATSNASLSALFYQVQQDYVALCANAELVGIASTLVGVA